MPLLLQQEPIIPPQQVAVRPPVRHHLVSLLLQGPCPLHSRQQATKVPPTTLMRLSSLAVVPHRRRLPQARVPPHYLIARAVRARRPVPSPFTVTAIGARGCAAGSSTSSSASAIRFTIVRQPTSLITHSTGRSRARGTSRHWSP